MAARVELPMVRPELLVFAVVAPFRAEFPAKEWKYLTKLQSAGYGSIVAQSPFRLVENPHLAMVEDYV